ncbi:FAD-dependent oxidoreductase [Curvibacter sp. CHRR-16]|uniref:NAD(P)/FAD-dependent oxidoreductase n=1 Tax=Curvibacter sp. CHRR-16 TaxID=2835872 RepID=UPI001BD9AF0E|nr:FAD-dependent oxidoreductase [Curvibacter sp. CHRR-16]MBT0569720.1 FAD-dependent oxidoreductase [Curvibacter sp. CHRR-16]
MGQGKLIIVGGGYLGAGLARRMDAHADVTLVEPREAFVHNSAMIRALVEPALLEQVLMPYDKLLQRGRVLRQRATALHADGVTLANGERLHADAVVVATGSRYALPFKPAGDSIEALRQACLDTHQQLQAAKTVVIIGGGAVGIELAGEIAASMPGKQITLVNKDPHFLPDYPDRLGQKIQSQLQAMGVHTMHSNYALRLNQRHAPYCGTVQLFQGQTLYADLIIPVVGASAQSELLTTLPDVQLGSAGRIITDDWLRPSPSMPKVFAAGDVADTTDGMTIVAALRQLPWLAKTLRRVLNGGPVQRGCHYHPWQQAPILLPLGPRKGNSWLPYIPTHKLAVQGPRLTSLMKGRDLFIPKYRKLFRLE